MYAYGSLGPWTRNITLLKHFIVRNVSVADHFFPKQNTPKELHKAVLQEAFIGLLRSTVRLDRPDAAAVAGGVLPETLAGDGGRLAAARDDVDRVTLVATLCVLVRQVLTFTGTTTTCVFFVFFFIVRVWTFLRRLPIVPSRVVRNMRVLFFLPAPSCRVVACCKHEKKPMPLSPAPSLFPTAPSTVHRTPPCPTPQSLVGLR